MELDHRPLPRLAGCRTCRASVVGGELAEDLTEWLDSRWTKRDPSTASSRTATAVLRCPTDSGPPVVRECEWRAGQNYSRTGTSACGLSPAVGPAVPLTPYPSQLRGPTLLQNVDVADNACLVREGFWLCTTGGRREAAASLDTYRTLSKRAEADVPKRTGSLTLSTSAWR